MKNNSKIKNQMTLLVSITALFFVASSCSPSQNENKAVFDLTHAKKEIEAANQNFMMLMSNGDSVGLADCYTVDAKMMGPNAPAVIGKKNIKTEIASFIGAGIAKVELKAIDVWGTAEMLTEEGELTMFTKDGQQIEQGKYLVIWKREDNKWKIFRDMFSSDLPLPHVK